MRQSPEMEIVNIHFHWGFWAKSQEFSGLMFLPKFSAFLQGAIHEQTSLIDCFVEISETIGEVWFSVRARTFKCIWGPSIDSKE